MSARTPPPALLPLRVTPRRHGRHARQAALERVHADLERAALVALRRKLLLERALLLEDRRLGADHLG